MRPRLHNRPMIAVAVGLAVGAAALASATRTDAGVAMRPMAAALSAATASPAPSSSSSFTPTPVPLNPCGPVWTVPADDVEGIVYFQLEPEPTAPAGVPLPPQLDLTQGTMAVSHSTLVVRLYVADMEKQVIAGSNADGWQMNWDIGSVSYFAAAAYHALDGSVTAVAGPLLDTTADQAVSASLVTGPGGYVEIDVPLALTGNPPAGTVLANIVGHAVVRNDGQGGNYTQIDADNGGPIDDYAIGQRCH